MSAVPSALSIASGVAGAKLNEYQLSAKYALAAAVAGGTAAAFLIVAATAALTLQVGLIYACLIMSAIFAAIAAGIVYFRRKAVRRAKHVAKVEATNAMVASVAKSALSPTTLSLAAVAAGYALSRK